ncbi:Myb-like DNA-binding domain containing protein [Tritrichomonas foetus]|uniref:Myb-like DNA-binding domain containing protein n=1 Tax=Tritrichomonas foetus TaxID=1144522 RepID=A0A1J4KL80_9EUKA|nr:Myb-like DNA-binding domain containing protein [Tritrichomonas foetus]|eukprot:OHT11696.1 Myb-like DNA-binding domain containing protein [Tritrichomonas foetus]
MIKTSNKQRFSKEEDMKIRQLVAIHGIAKWDLIAFMIPGKTPRQIRDRFTNYLFPNCSHHQWTMEEDMLLKEKFKELGPKWKRLSQFFIGRTPNSIKNRWNTYLSKQFKSCTIQFDQKIHDDIFNMKPADSSLNGNILVNSTSNFNNLILNNDNNISSFEQKSKNANESTDDNDYDDSDGSDALTTFDRVISTNSKMNVDDLFNLDWAVEDLTNNNFPYF